MSDIDSNAYRVLKHLSRAENSFGFPTSDSYWISYLTKMGLSKPSFIKIPEKGDYSVDVITEQGRSFIKDHRKNTIKSWIIIIAAVSAAITGLIAILLK